MLNLRDIFSKEFQYVYVGDSCEHVKEINQRKYYNFRLQTIKFEKPESLILLQHTPTCSTFSWKYKRACNMEMRSHTESMGLRIYTYNYNLGLLKAQVSFQLGKIFSSDNEVSVYIMYLYMYWLLH